MERARIAHDLRNYVGSATANQDFNEISINKEDAIFILEILSNTLPRAQMLVDQGLVTSKRRGAERDALQYQLDALGRVYARTVAYVEVLTAQNQNSSEAYAKIDLLNSKLDELRILAVELRKVANDREESVMEFYELLDAVETAVAI